MARKKTDTGSYSTRLLALLLLVVLCALCVLGWRWQESLVVEQVDVAGAHQATRSALLELARIDTGAVLFGVDPALVADRVQRHPWVRTASVSRLPTGVLRIAVDERTPVLLALDDRDRPSHYVDAEGYQMPLADSLAFDVPLLRGLDAAYHPIRKVEPASVRALAATLGAVADDALLAELELRPDGELWAYLVSSSSAGTVPVRLGRDDFDVRLRRLRAFWQSAVEHQPEKTFHLIDLRFDGQIVTREGQRPGREAGGDVPGASTAQVPDAARAAGGSRDY